MWETTQLTKAVYVSHLASQGLVWPFVALFASRHASEFAVGLALGTARVVQVAAAPSWTSLADSRAVGRARILTGCLVMWLASGASLVAVAAWSYWATFATLVARAAVEAPLIPLIDAAVLEALRHGKFGRSRLWGSAAYGGSALCAGVVFARFGFAANVALSAVVSLATLAIARALLLRERPPPRERQPSRERAAARLSSLNPFEPRRGLEELEALTTRPTMNPFDTVEVPPLPKSRARAARAFATRLLPSVVVVGAGFGLLSSCLFRSLRALGASSPLVCGAAIFLECLVEVPVFHAADAIVDRFGPARLLAAVHLLYALRCAAFALAPLARRRPYLLVFLVQPLHGLTFGLFYTAGVRTAKALLPAHCAAFAQGCFAAAFAAGDGLGAFFGALLLNRLGFQPTFLVFAALFLLAAAAAAAAPPDDSSDLPASPDDRAAARSSDDPAAALPSLASADNPLHHPRRDHHLRDDDDEGLATKNLAFRPFAIVDEDDYDDLHLPPPTQAA